MLNGDGTDRGRWYTVAYTSSDKRKQFSFDIVIIAVSESHCIEAQQYDAFVCHIGHSNATLIVRHMPPDHTVMYFKNNTFVASYAHTMDIIHRKDVFSSENSTPHRIEDRTSPHIFYTANRRDEFFFRSSFFSHCKYESNLILALVEKKEKKSVHVT